MGILWGYPLVFLWVWDGYGDRNSDPTAALALTDEYERCVCVEYKALFTKFDHDSSESIETSELGDALRYLGCNPLDSEVEAMIAEADGKCKPAAA